LNQAQKVLSPVTHVASGKTIPPFVILHVADHPETRGQSQRLAKVLQDAGISAKAAPAQGKNHGTINSDLGKPGDGPTNVMFEFLEDLLNRAKKSP
jgi:acetyl esterase/lipase